jgi:hypothetical protein
MDLEPKTMASAVEETSHTPVVFARFIAFAREVFLNGLMDFGRGHAGAHFDEGDLLALLNRRVEFADRFAGAATHDCASDIAKIAGLLRTGKDVNNYGLIGAQ